MKMVEVMIEYIEEKDDVKSIRKNHSEEAIGRYMEKYESGTSKPILVKKINRQKYILIDGHHRLEAIKRLKRKKIDINIVDIKDEEIYDKAVESNQDNGVPLTKEEEDNITIELFNQGKTQEQMAKIFHVSQQAIAKRFKNNKILDLQLSCKINTSTINELLSGKTQTEVANNYKITQGRVSQIYNDWRNGIEEEYERGSTKEEIVESQNKNKINLTLDYLEEIFEGDYNKLIVGDCLNEIPKLEDESIDCVIIDPPYGINYKSNHRKEKYDYIMDDNENAFELLNNSLKVVFNKMKKNSHIYIFTSWKVIEKVKPIISKYFELKNCLVWNKNNWGMGDLKNNYAEKYELILFATKGKRPLYAETRPLNVIDCERADTEQHPTRKPINLLKQLIINSTKPKELVLDFFAGSCSTLEASKEENRKWLGIDVKDYGAEVNQG